MKILEEIKYDTRVSVRPADPGDLQSSTATPDAAAVATLYNHYITNTVATFEEEPITAVDAAERIKAVQDAGYPWLVAEFDGATAGYTYATSWKARPAYRYTVEVSIYVEPDLLGQGVGTALYRHLLPVLAEQGIHSALGGISLPNPTSAALHEKFGFRPVATLPEVGFKFDRWIDIGYWQFTFPED